MTEYDKNDYVKKKINAYYKNKSGSKKYANKCKDKRSDDRRIDTIHKIYDNMKRRIFDAFQKYNISFKWTYEELIGCNCETLRIHLSSKFVDGMTLENYGLWEVDHIKPISKFDFNDQDQVFKCFNYENTQPLWRSDNRRKSNKIVVE
jgi:hypothetical protein